MPQTRSWKRKAKSHLKKLISWRDNTFFAFGPKALGDAIVELGINQGDTLFVHSSLDAFGGFRGKPSDVITTLQNAVGRHGMVMMPTMAFDGTAIAYVQNTPVVDLKRAPSRMGLLTELFRRAPDVVRSAHPTHPIAVWGDEATQVIAGHHLANTPCGAPGPLHQLLKRNGKIVFLGTDINVMTFYHTLEDILESRLPVSPFTKETYALGVKDEADQIWHCNTRLYDPAVSRRRSLGVLRAELRRMHAWHERKVGRLGMVVVHAVDVLKAIEQLLDRGITCYE